MSGWFLGIPSLASLLSLGGSWLALDEGAAPGPSQQLDINTYGLVALLADGAEGLGKILEFVAGLAIWVVVAVAIVSLVTLLLAVALYVTGRGIARRATWARIVAGLMSLGLLLGALGLLTVLSGDLTAVACLPLAVSLYMLWVLCWRFA